MDGRHASLADQPLILSNREWDLLTTLAAADGHSVPKERLLADGSVNALEVYLCRLRRRLEVAGLNIRTVRGFGYRLEVASEVAASDPTLPVSLRFALVAAVPSGIVTITSYLVHFSEHRREDNRWFGRLGGYLTVFLSLIHI